MLALRLVRNLTSGSGRSCPPVYLAFSDASVKRVKCKVLRSPSRRYLQEECQHPVPKKGTDSQKIKSNRITTYITVATIIQVTVELEIPGFSQRLMPGCGEHSLSARLESISTTACLKFVATWCIDVGETAIGGSARGAIVCCWYCYDQFARGSKRSVVGKYRRCLKQENAPCKVVNDNNSCSPFQSSRQFVRSPDSSCLSKRE